MHVLSITNLQAVLILAALFVTIWFIITRIPGRYQPRIESFTPAQISAYDRQVPKFFLVGGLALLIGALHTILKNLPGVYGWLWRAGYGGHLARDAANSHIVIMGGGTLLLIGLTWYVLPRLAQRPLYSRSLANLSLWLIVIGVSGSYLSWIMLGLVEGSLVAQGWTYAAAKESLGLWHKLPVAASSGIMGIGFWMVITNVFVTAGLAGRVRHRPQGHLVKFSVVTALAFLIGTLQGIVQVMPDNVAWLEAAGPFGRLVDPVSHVHMNLLGGMFVTLVMLLLFFSQRLGGTAFNRRAADGLFRTIVPAVFTFYLVALTLGLAAGNLANGYGGLDLGRFGPLVLANSRGLLAIAGIFLMLAFWRYFLALWRSFRLKSILSEVRQASPRGFWLVSSLALALGTLQGLLQALPGSARLLTLAEEVPNIHAQFNMIAGIVLALIGLVYFLLPELTGQSLDDQPAHGRWQRFSLYAIAGGSLAYYLVSLGGGLARARWLAQGLNDVQAAQQLGLFFPLLLSLSAAVSFSGFLAFYRVLWRSTHAYRQAWKAELLRMPARYNGKAMRIRQRMSLGSFLLIEAIFGVFGFPGMGWLFSGDAMVGMPLLIGGSLTAWAIVPILLSVYGKDLSPPGIVQAQFSYLFISMLLSVTSLAFALYRYKIAREA